MVSATGLRAGMIVKQESELYRVIASETHAGGGQTGRMVHTRAKNLRTGHIRDWRFNPEEKLEDVSLQRQEMEYIYSDGDNFYFMNPETFEQIPLAKETIGVKEKFLQPNMRIPVESYEGEPIHVVFPETVELRVASAPTGFREHDSSTYKRVVLENGMEVLAPQFIKEGEFIRIDVETGKYLERVRKG